MRVGKFVSPAGPFRLKVPVWSSMVPALLNWLASSWRRCPRTFLNVPLLMNCDVGPAAVVDASIVLVVERAVVVEDGAVGQSRSPGCVQPGGRVVGGKVEPSAVNRELPAMLMVMSPLAKIVPAPCGHVP